VTRRLGFALAFASLAWARVAAAEAGKAPLDLTWVAPSGCSDAKAVQAEVLRLAGPRGVGPLDAHGVLEQRGTTWHLVLTTTFEGASGERRLQASSCRALTEAAALTLALILNPETEVPHEAPREPPASPPAPETAPLRVRALLTAYGGVHAGILGSPGLEVGLGAGISVERLALRLAGTFGPPRDEHVSGDSGPGGRLWFVAGSALGCFELGQRVVVGPCTGVALTHVAGEGINVASPASGSTRWVSILFGLTAGVPVSRAITLGGGAHALIPTRRPTLYLDDLGAVQRPAPVGVELRAGVEFGLP